MTAQGVTWAIVLLVAVVLAAALTLRNTVAGKSMWPALIAIWAALAVAGHVFTQSPKLKTSAVVAATLALPILVAGVGVRLQLGAGRGRRFAFGVAVTLGAIAAALTPVLQLGAVCALLGDCL